MNRSLVRASEFSMERNHELGQLETGLGFEEYRQAEKRREDRVESKNEK